jgi:hypothetical protein
MGKAFDHILQELDHISLQERVALRDLLEKKLAAVDRIGDPRPANGSVHADPLAGLRIDTGIEDLAERFDDYRFGQQLP